MVRGFVVGLQNVAYNASFSIRNLGPLVSSLLLTRCFDVPSKRSPSLVAVLNSCPWYCHLKVENINTVLWIFVLAKLPAADRHHALRIHLVKHMAVGPSSFLRRPPNAPSDGRPPDEPTHANEGLK